MSQKKLLETAGQTPPPRLVKKKKVSKAKEKSPVIEKSITKKRKKKKLEYPIFHRYIFKVLKDTHHELSISYKVNL
jgi:hypothetical protein